MGLLPETGESSEAICERIGESMPDIAGIGILLAFSAQALISMILAFWVFFLSKLGRLGSETSSELASDRKRLKLISSILMTGNDAQMLTGGALIITAWTRKDLDLYHTHLIYDTVSFVGISNCAAIICLKLLKAKDDSNAPLPAGKSPLKRLHPLGGLDIASRATCVFATLYFILAVTLEVRLAKWSESSDDVGHCYKTQGIASPGANHPASDQAYVAITAIWSLSVMLLTVFGGIRLRKPLLICSALQFPVHFYFMIMLRQANFEHLEGEESENDWDFGQTAATLLLATTCFELFRKLVQLRLFEKDVIKGGSHHAIKQAEIREEHPETLPGGPVSLAVDSLLKSGSHA